MSTTATRPARVALVLCSIAAAIAFTAPLQAQKAEPDRAPNYDLAAQWTSQKVGKLVFDTSGHAAVARDERSLLVRVSDARGPAVLVRRSDQEDQGAAVRSREDGGGADLDHAHSLRRAAPAVLDGALRQERHGVRVRRAGAGRRGDRDAAQARRPPSRRGRARRARRVRQPDDDDPQQRSAAGAAAGARPAPENADAALRVRPGDRARSRCSSDYKEEPRPPRWASLSPDGKTVVFARKNNLFMMDADNYAKALKKADDPTIVEVAAHDRRRRELQLRPIGARDPEPARAGTAAAATAAATRARRRSSRTTSATAPTRTRACRRSPSSGRATRTSSRSSAAIRARWRTCG